MAKRNKTYIVSLTPLSCKKVGEVEIVEVEGNDIAVAQCNCEYDIGVTQILGTDGSVVYQVPSVRVIDIKVKKAPRLKAV